MARPRPASPARLTIMSFAGEKRAPAHPHHRQANRRHCDDCTRLSAGAHARTQVSRPAGGAPGRAGPKSSSCAWRSDLSWQSSSRSMVASQGSFFASLLATGKSPRPGAGGPLQFDKDGVRAYELIGRPNVGAGPQGPGARRQAPACRFADGLPRFDSATVLAAFV